MVMLCSWCCCCHDLCGAHLCLVNFRSRTFYPRYRTFPFDPARTWVDAVDRHAKNASLTSHCLFLSAQNSPSAVSVAMRTSWPGSLFEVEWSHGLIRCLVHDLLAQSYSFVVLHYPVPRATVNASLSSPSWISMTWLCGYQSCGCVLVDVLPVTAQTTLMTVKICLTRQNWIDLRNGRAIATSTIGTLITAW